MHYINVAVTAAATPIATDETSPRYAGWRVVAACSWSRCSLGFRAYGHGVYLVELQRVHGWPASLIASAASAYYLFSATLVIYVSDAITRLRPRAVVLTAPFAWATPSR